MYLSAAALEDVAFAAKKGDAVLQMVAVEDVPTAGEYAVMQGDVVAWEDVVLVEAQ